MTDWQAVLAGILFIAGLQTRSSAIELAMLRATQFVKTHSAYGSFRLAAVRDLCHEPIHKSSGSNGSGQTQAGRDFLPLVYEELRKLGAAHRTRRRAESGVQRRLGTAAELLKNS